MQPCYIQMCVESPSNGTYIHIFICVCMWYRYMWYRYIIYTVYVVRMQTYKAYTQCQYK